MNLHQFRVLTALPKLGPEFTTADIVRETGVSSDVVRKVYQRHSKFFRIVREDGSHKVRAIAESALEELMTELRKGSAHLEPLERVLDPESEPLGLAAAEQVLYVLIPLATLDDRAVLLDQIQTHLKYSGRYLEYFKSRDLSSANQLAVKSRYLSARHLFQLIFTLHTAAANIDSYVSQLSLKQYFVRLVEICLSANASRSQGDIDIPTYADIWELATAHVAGPRFTELLDALLAINADLSWRTHLQRQPSLYSPRDTHILHSLRTFTCLAGARPNPSKPITNYSLRDVISSTVIFDCPISTGTLGGGFDFDNVTPPAQSSKGAAGTLVDFRFIREFARSMFDVPSTYSRSRSVPKASAL